MIKNQNIAIVATGDEITQGDVINTNGAYIARMLNQAGFQIGQHCSVPDEQESITQVLEQIMQTHQTIITIGGLGPTCDDITRQCVAAASKHPLVFNHNNWLSIQEFFVKKQCDIPESNRQQAYFPKNAIIIPNHRGTAAGCLLHTKNNTWIMLPGPPSECLVMMKKQILPLLIEHQQPAEIYRYRWLLLGSGESQIAAKINQLPLHPKTQLGYRCHHPYLDVKIKAQTENTLLKDRLLIESIIDSPICPKGQKASDRLVVYLKKNKLSIHDHTTGGILESLLNQPETHHHLHFNQKYNDDTWLITGLSEYWLNKPTTYTSIQITHKQKTETLSIRNKTDLTPHIAAELICHHIIIKTSGRQ